MIGRFGFYMKRRKGTKILYSWNLHESITVFEIEILKSSNLTTKSFSLQITYVANESHSVVSDSLRPHGLYSPWSSPGQNTGVGSLSLLQRIFPTQGLNPGLPHCRQILYQLSHKGRPIFEIEILKYSNLTTKSFSLQITYVAKDLTNFPSWSGGDMCP